MSATQELKNEALRIVRNSLEGVGKQKAVGYLPVGTIMRVLNDSVENVTERFSSRGLQVVVFEEGDTCIGSGAVFIYEASAVKELTEEHGEAISQRGLHTPEQVIVQISRQWYDSDHPMMPFIRALYNDTTHL